jgi:hypothetical protein
MERPKTICALLSSGGVKEQMRLASEEAARNEAQYWLSTLQAALKHRDLTKGQKAAIEKEIRALKRRLGISPTIEDVKAQANERAKRYYQRKKEARILSANLSPDSKAE